MAIRWKQASLLVAGFSDYWRIYGGFRGVLASPYFLVSIAFTGVVYPFWLAPGWWDIPLQVMPNVLSFSLGGFAILLAFGDEKFRSRIAGKVDGEESESPYLQVTASFMHFILLQVLSLAIALLAKAWAFSSSPVFLAKFSESIIAATPFFWGVGFFVFVYSLFAAVAALMAIFVLVQSFDSYQTLSRRQERLDEEAFLREAASKGGVSRALGAHSSFGSDLDRLVRLERRGLVLRDRSQTKFGESHEVIKFVAFITPEGRKSLQQG